MPATRTPARKSDRKPAVRATSPGGERPKLLLKKGRAAGSRSKARKPAGEGTRSVTATLPKAKAAGAAGRASSKGASNSGSSKAAGSRAAVRTSPGPARSNGKARGGSRIKRRYTAATADRYELYQKAVQSADVDIEFLARVFRATRGRKALHFREDFCGTGLLSATWIHQGPEHTAEGFDIDPEPIAWGLQHNFGPDHGGAQDERARYTVHLKDVREPGHRQYDLRVAQNFSYCVFATREELLEYFRAARASLVEDGLFVIDLHGGNEATEEITETKRCGGFTYVWEQAAFYPGTGEYTCNIHFRFPDGTQLKNAFRYSWRMWYLTELKDVLVDAGFKQVDTYFEGTDEKGTGGDGIFRKHARGENCLSWIAYLVAQA